MNAEDVVYSAEKTFRMLCQMAWETRIPTLDRYGTVWDIPVDYARPFESVKDMETWANVVLGRRGIAPVTVGLSKRGKNWSNGSYEKAERTILMPNPREHWTRPFLVHEMAHVSFLGHGPKWRQEFRDLLEMTGGVGLGDLWHMVLMEETALRQGKSHG